MTPQNPHLKQGLFDRWFIVNGDREEFAWSGRRWVLVDPRCFPVGEIQVCNFDTREQAASYAAQAGIPLAEETGGAQ
jgi:hypothetical protein